MKGDALSRYQARYARLGAGPLAVGELLEVVGDVLRRSDRLGTDGVEEALKGLDRPGVEAWLAQQKPQALQPLLLRAAEESMEVALGEEGEEAELWRASALEGLAARDRAASAARALVTWEMLKGPLDGDAAAARERFLGALGHLDSALRSRARWFIPLNTERRAERDLLDPVERPGAWWFSARAGCDDLVASWTGRPMKDPEHLKDCASCRADRADTAVVDTPPRRHLTDDELWRLDSGEMSREERERVEAHTASCGECAQAVLALDEGDAAIDEALELEEEGAQVSRSARDSRADVARRPSAARLPEHREVLEERRDFRVVLVRERQRVRLLVQPLGTRAVTAAVFLSPGRPSLKPTQGPEGLSFDLSTALATGAHAAHLTVQAGQETLERDFAF
ncbi:MULTISPECIES: zf-HC2 domain-containing protein [unclassified Corallococcus]|uniref:zf-HC2 domain-containing protein n=1 Tax=unclassified Corallococcus TaxID=2685029 RepID=UPI001A8F3903|nr:MULTISPECIES: zf-HC2 domain-containing protein [unclassified Corallococcus]MBN9687721.1 zf-HC2 domain-containing protein [Corallococcus sp. NCSPR001]WAS88466.1 zf-HC2 domain-containing protein [Corallococcus sp. NCRR]